MKHILCFFLFFGLGLSLFCQNSNNPFLDSQLKNLSHALNDTNKVNLLNTISKAFNNSDHIKAIDYGKQALAFATSLQFAKGMADAYNNIGNGLCNIGEFQQALSHFDTALKIGNKIKYRQGLATTYNDIGIVYIYKGNYNKALTYLNNALIIREEIGDKKDIAYSLNNIGSVYQSQGNYTGALEKYNAALHELTLIDDKKGMASCYDNMGLVYRNEGNFPEALKNHLASFKINEVLKNKIGIANNYGNIGILYQENSDYKTALRNHLSALKLFQELQNKNGIAVTYNNVSIIYYSIDSLDIALQYLKKALKLNKEINDNNAIGNTFSNIGDIYNKRRQYKEALKNYSSALEVFSANGDTTSLAAVYGSFAQVYNEQKLYSIAENYALKGLYFAQQTETLEWIKNNHETLSNIYAGSGKFEKALIEYKAYEIAKDSLLNKDKIKKTVQVQMQYDFDKKQTVEKINHEKQMALLQARNKAQLQMWATIAIAIFAISFISFFFYRKKEKDKFSLQIATAKQEALIAQLDTHFISDTIVSINSFIKNNNKEAASNYLLTFGTIIRNVLENSFEKMILLEDALNFLEEYLSIVALHYPDKHIACLVNVDEQIETGDTLMPPMILQALAENAIQHAFVNKKDGKIIIDVQKNGNTIFCAVEDNGIGRKVSVNPSKTRQSYGNTLSERLLKVWDKTVGKTTYKILDLTDENGNATGTRAEFSFPYVTN